MLELKQRDALGRCGIFHTKHGVVETPTLLPVINPNQMLITPRALKKKFGAQMVITNSYIIYKNEDLRERALKNGVHGLIDFDGPTMTDSGTFQNYVYGDVALDPLEIVKFQRDIGSDVGTILDIFITPETKLEEAKKGVEETLQRARASADISGEMTLACTVQGGVFPELREECARQLSLIDGTFNPIGGVVPLMERQRYADLVRVILSSKRGLAPNRTVHLFGCGHPMIFALAAALGCDLFDSASYAKYAKAGRMLFADGTRVLNELTELPCSCPICTSYSAAELRSLPDEERTRCISEHNLYVSFEELRRVREAIRGGFLWELAEQRCRAHPTLLDALKVLRDYQDFIERYTPISKNSAFFYTGPESVHRVEAHRYARRFFERYTPPKKDVLIVFSEGKKPYSRFYADAVAAVRERCDAQFIVQSFFGPVPLELDEIFPIAQSVIPKQLDEEASQHVKQLMKRFSHEMPYSIGIFYDGKETLDALEMIGSLNEKSGGVRGSIDECAADDASAENESEGERETALPDDIKRIKAVAEYQFGIGSGDALFNGEITLVKSKKTRKIRNVWCDGAHVASMRADDGFFTLKIAGAKKLHRRFEAPKLRVIVSEDSVEFNKQGKSVFAKFVVECDDEIRPKDEVLVVSEKDELVGVGRALMNREEMRSFTIGVAVKITETI